MHHLLDRDLRVIPFLVAKFKSTTKRPVYVFNEEIEKECGESRRDIIDIITRLTDEGLVGWADTGSFYIKKEIIDFARDLNTPPARDYVNEIKTWWFSKPILAAVVVLVISLTAIATLAVTLKALLPSEAP